MKVQALLFCLWLSCPDHCLLILQTTAVRYENSPNENSIRFQYPSISLDVQREAHQPCPRGWQGKKRIVPRLSEGLLSG